MYFFATSLSHWTASSSVKSISGVTFVGKRPLVGKVSTKRSGGLKLLPTSFVAVELFECVWPFCGFVA